jgi:ribosomal protein S10
MLIISFKSTDKTTQQIYKHFLKTLLTKFKSFLLKTDTKLVINFINLPNKLNKISLLKSPHVNKKAFEQFQLKTYKSIVTLKTDKDSKHIFNSLLGQKILKSIFINKPKNIKLLFKFKENISL